MIDGKRYRWASAFDNLGRLTLTIHRRALPALAVTLEGDVEPDRIVGRLTDGVSSSTIELERTIAAADRSLLPLQGPYTVTFPPEGAAAAETQGYGIGLLNVSTYSAVRLSATLADGTKVSNGGALDSESAFSFHAPIYSRRGFLAGKVSFRGRPNVNDAGRTLLWSKPFRPAASRFKPALIIHLPVRAAKFRY